MRTYIIQKSRPAPDITALIALSQYEHFGEIIHEWLEEYVMENHIQAPIADDTIGKLMMLTLEQTTNCLADCWHSMTDDQKDMIEHILMRAAKNQKLEGKYAETFSSVMIYVGANESVFRKDEVLTFIDQLLKDPKVKDDTEKLLHSSRYAKHIENYSTQTRLNVPALLQLLSGGEDIVRFFQNPNHQHILHALNLSAKTDYLSPKKLSDTAARILNKQPKKK